MTAPLSLPYMEHSVHWRAYRPVHETEPVLVVSVRFENYRFIKVIERTYQGSNAKKDAEAFLNYCRKTDGSKVNLIQKKDEL